MSCSSGEREQLHPSAITIGKIRVGIEFTKEQDAAKAAELEKWLEQVLVGTYSGLGKFLLLAFGSLPLGAIGRDQVASLHYKLHKMPTMANQVVDTPSRLFVMAKAWVWRRREGTRAGS